MVRYSTLILLLIAFMPSARAQTRHAEPKSTVRTVSFCDMLRDPQLYDKQVIRLEAIFTRGGEDWVAIYCPACSTDQNLLKPGYSESFDRLTNSKVTAKADIAERTGGYEDWLFIFANWREDGFETHDDKTFMSLYRAYSTALVTAVEEAASLLPKIAKG